MEGIILASPLLLLIVTFVSSSGTRRNCIRVTALGCLYTTHPEFLYNLLPAHFSPLALKLSSIENIKVVSDKFRSSSGLKALGGCSIAFSRPVNS